jgi:hypothetical protein
MQEPGPKKHNPNGNRIRYFLLRRYHYQFYDLKNGGVELNRYMAMIGFNGMARASGREIPL